MLSSHKASFFVCLKVQPNHVFRAITLAPEALISLDYAGQTDVTAQPSPLLFTLIMCLMVLVCRYGDVLRGSQQLASIITEATATGIFLHM